MDYIFDYYFIITGLVPTNSSLFMSSISSWESSAQDFGLGILFSHLDSARAFIKNLPLYKRNAHTILADQSRLDDLLEESFRYVDLFFMIRSIKISRDGM